MMEFMSKKKYPQTPHLDFSKSIQGDDVKVSGILKFLEGGTEAVVTEKMDGESTTFYTDSYHARSIDSRFHPSRSIVAQFHGNISHMIPKNMRIILENCYAEHSIRYERLPTFIFGIGVVENIRGVNYFKSWAETLNIFEDLGITPAPILYSGEVDLTLLENIYSKLDFSLHEGIVVRSMDAFPEGEFSLNVAKAVRPGHVQTSDHWTKTWRPNSLS